MGKICKQESRADGNSCRFITSRGTKRCGQTAQELRVYANTNQLSFLPLLVLRASGRVWSVARGFFLSVSYGEKTLEKYGFAGVIIEVYIACGRSLFFSLNNTDMKQSLNIVGLYQYLSQYEKKTIVH